MKQKKYRSVKRISSFLTAALRSVKYSDNNQDQQAIVGGSDDLAKWRKNAAITAAQADITAAQKTIVGGCANETVDIATEKVERVMRR